MEFNINNKIFSKALNLVHSVVPATSNYPIFKNVLLKANYQDQTLLLPDLMVIQVKLSLWMVLL